MHQQGESVLAAAGYAQYEVSAYAQPGRQCRHNRNYWEFGDYLGIGAGAHGKLTDAGGAIWRTAKQRHPRAYLDNAGSMGCLQRNEIVPAIDLPLEYLMNALRLNGGFDLAEFSLRTGLATDRLQPGLQQALARNLVQHSGSHVCATPLGRRHLDGLLTLFVPGQPGDGSRHARLAEAAPLL
jgi:oxygen-independent coproporphyrinogen-3 oxidase